MPVIPSYKRQFSIPGEGPGALQDPGSAGMVGNAITGLGKTALNATEDVSNMIVKRDLELKKQKQDAILIDKGSQISDDVLNYEIAYQKENKGVNASGSVERASKYTSTLFDKYKVDGDEEINNKLKQHIAAHDQGLKTKLAGYEAAELKNYSTDVRVLDYETSRKMAQNGDVATAIINYKKTLDTQKANYSLSPEDYQIELKKGTSGILESYIESLLVANPSAAQETFKLAKKDLLSDTAEKLEAKIKPAVALREGMDAGVEVFKADTTGSLEKMTDAVRAKKLNADSEKVAIAQVKELFNERKIDDDNKKKAVFDGAYDVLTKTALAGGGRLNRLSDIPPAKWAEMMAIDPKTTMQIQDKISGEQRQQANINKAEVRAAKQEQRLQQADNESALLIADDFQTRDLKKELSLGNISPPQYRNLLEMQTKLDPIKRFSVKNALAKVTSGTALDKALNVKGNEAAVWKLKYGDLVKAWAYKNADDPAFDDNLNKFVEKHVLSDMVTSWLSGDDADRQEKFQKAKAEAGELPKKGNTPTQADLEYTAKKHGLTVDQVKQKLGIK